MFMLFYKENTQKFIPLKLSFYVLQTSKYWIILKIKVLHRTAKQRKHLYSISHSDLKNIFNPSQRKTTWANSNHFFLIDFYWNEKKSLMKKCYLQKRNQFVSFNAHLSLFNLLRVTNIWILFTKRICWRGDRKKTHFHWYNPWTCFFQYTY
jgi:hypothetical protein